MNAFLLAAAGFASCALLFVEWRRPERRRRLPRSAATVGAVAALVWLAVPPDTGPTASMGSTAATLWTAGDSSGQAQASPFQFALPEAARNVPIASFIPDAGTLRRRFPNLRSLLVLGDGLDPAELPALTGLQLTFQPSSAVPATTPQIRFFHCPCEVPLGSAFAVTGRLLGLPPGGTFPLSLEAPDGQKNEVLAGPADPRGETNFDLRAPALPATGQFVWRLRGGTIDESIGVSVVRPTLPRILVLESAPHFDTAALRRWFETMGGQLTLRTQIGKDLYRYAGTRGDVPQFTTLTPPLLAEADLVLADAPALAALHPEELAALRAAVEGSGLGLLVMAEEAALFGQNAQVSPDRAALFPWKLAPFGDAAANEERTERLHWTDQDLRADTPLPVVPLNLEPQNDQTSLLTDGQQRPLAAAVRRGRGEVAVTLVRDTSRFLRANDPAAFAAGWSFLFSRLSRPADPSAGRWTLLDGEAGPVFVDHPLALRWTGPAEKAPFPAWVMSGQDGTQESLALAQDPTDPGSWQGTFWPRQPGWHRIAPSPDSAPLNFYVHPRDAWPALQAERRRTATARFASASAPPGHSDERSIAARTTLSPVWSFLLFVLAVGYLWTERRFAGGPSTG